MQPYANELDEVTVQGRSKITENRSLPTKPESYNSAFGKVDLRSKGSSTYYVSGEDINPAYPSLDDALAAKIPGGLSRKTNSMNIGSPTLYEIDGQLYTDITWFDWRTQIEHVFVEKSLSATLKYGFMGRGGVLVIKTISDPNKPRNKVQEQSALNKEVYHDDATPYARKYIAYEKAALYDENGFSEYVETLNQNISELRYLAYACQAAGQHVRAIQLYRQILALRPDDVQAIRDLAHAFALSGRPKNAWHTYLMGLELNGGQFNEALSGIEFQEMKQLYAAGNLREDFPNVLTDSRELDGMKEPITRLVFEWGDPNQSFIVEAVNPQGQVSRTEITAGLRNAPIEELYLDSSLAGDWQFNFDREKEQEVQILLKVSIFRNWGAIRTQPEIQLFKFDASDQGKFLLLNLKV